MATANTESIVASIEVMEAALPPLIDRHLAWVPHSDSPSSELNNSQYGVKPIFFNADLSQEGLRPKREPVDFSLIAADVLGVDPQDPMFEELVRTMDGHYDFDTSSERPKGWFGFLLSEGIDPEVVKSIKEISEESYKVNMLTEDNLPAYVIESLGIVREFAHKLGVRTPALEEWFRGIWPAEEDGHKVAMNHYGQIRRLTTSRAHVAGRTSQLRSGTEVSPSTVIDVFAYTPRQEFATKIAHENDSLLTGPFGGVLLNRIAKDETRHEDLYSSVLGALLQDPRLASIAVQSLRTSYEGFFMPGLKGIPDFVKRSLKVDKAAIFGRREDFESAKHILVKIGLFKKNKEGSYEPVANLDDNAQEDLAWLRENYDKEFEDKPRRKPVFVLGETITKSELRDMARKFRQLKGLPDRLPRP